MKAAELFKLAHAHHLVASGKGRKVRLANGLSCDHVGGAIGTAGVTVWRWEAGLRKPTGKPALRYAELIDVLAKVRA